MTLAIPPLRPKPNQDRILRRLDRQFDALARHLPQLERPLRGIRRRGLWVIRAPLAILLIMGGVLSFLPILGLWMLPAGLMLLAVDLPILRAPLSASLVRWRRRVTNWKRRWLTWT